MTTGFSQARRADECTAGSANHRVPMPTDSEAPKVATQMGHLSVSALQASEQTQHMPGPDGPGKECVSPSGFNQGETMPGPAHPAENQTEPTAPAANPAKPPSLPNLEEVDAESDANSVETPQ